VEKNLLRKLFPVQKKKKDKNFYLFYIKYFDRVLPRNLFFICIGYNDLSIILIHINIKIIIELLKTRFYITCTYNTRFTTKRGKKTSTIVCTWYLREYNNFIKKHAIYLISLTHWQITIMYDMNKIIKGQKDPLQTVLVVSCIFFWSPCGSKIIIIENLQLLFYWCIHSLSWFMYEHTKYRWVKFLKSDH